jgi:hypothetical protein
MVVAVGRTLVLAVRACKWVIPRTYAARRMLQCSFLGWPRAQVLLRAEANSRAGR